MNLGFYLKFCLILIVLRTTCGDPLVIYEGVFLYKCSQGVGEFLSIGNQLKLPYGQEKLEYFEQVFNTSSIFNFTLIEKKPTCRDNTFEINIPRNLDSSQLRLFNFTPDGYLGTFKDNEEIYFHRDNFCISNITENLIGVEACKSTCNFGDGVKTGNVCIEKCCTLGQVMTPRGCKDVNGADWSPSIYSHLKSKEISQPQVYPQIQYNLFNHHWKCPPGKIPEQRLIKSEDLKILTDGRIFAKKAGKEYWFPLVKPGEGRSFCLDGVWLGGDEFDAENSTNFVMKCKSNVTTEVDDIFELDVYPQIVFGVTLLATLIHLLTVTVHICLWDKQQNVHGWTIFLFCCSQMFITLFLCGLFGVFGFGHPERDLLGPLHGLCVTIGIVHHFLLIFSFSCCSVLTFDVWFKLRSKTTSTGKGQKKFLAYCCLGIGIPTIIVLSGILMEFVIGDTEEGDDNLIRPGYSKTCIIQNSWQYFYYIALHITILFILNMTLALLTLKSLWDAMRSMKILKGPDSSTSATFENKAQLVGKLMVMMGVFLLIEIILAFTSPIQVSRFFVILDFYRIFHAIGLFWIFVCNKRTLTQLSSKFPSIKRVTGQLQQASPQTVSVLIDSSKDSPRKASVSEANTTTEHKL